MLLTETRANDTPPVDSRIYAITEHIILFSLFVYAISAPHSIAVTQGSFLLGAAAWLVQMLADRRFRPWRTPIDLPLLGFFACCVVSSFLSYDPLISIKGLRSPAFFLAFYLVCNKVKDIRFARVLVLGIIASCLGNVAYSGVQLAIGRGVQIDTLAYDSPLLGYLEPGDVILEADGRKVRNLDDLSRIVDEGRGRVQILFQRTEAVTVTTVSRRAIRESPGTGPERFGISASRGRNFRISGIYNHYETYAEVLQLIASLAIGMLVVDPRRRSRRKTFLIVSLVLIVAALLLTSTRAAIAGLALSVVVISILRYGRRAALGLACTVVILLVAAGLVLQHSRGISFIDLQEGSTAYRLAVWQEALSLVKSHPLFGIGKGSEGNPQFKREFGLYDDGKLPPGHFHSTPIQIATWWGLIALTFYVTFMTILIVECWKLACLARARGHWETWGIALGAVGGLAAFNLSSLAHFNFGDGEVVMMLWLMAGIGFAVRRFELQSEGCSDVNAEVSGGLDKQLVDNDQPQKPEQAIAVAPKNLR